MLYGHGVNALVVDWYGWVVVGEWMVIVNMGGYISLGGLLVDTGSGAYAVGLEMVAIDEQVGIYI